MKMTMVREQDTTGRKTLRFYGEVSEADLSKLPAETLKQVNSDMEADRWLDALVLIFNQGD